MYRTEMHTELKCICINTKLDVSLDDHDRRGAADARVLGTLAVSQAAPVRMVLHSHSDDELPLRLFWSPVPPRLGGSHHAHLRPPREALRDARHVRVR